MIESALNSLLCDSVKVGYSKCQCVWVDSVSNGLDMFRDILLWYCGNA